MNLTGSALASLFTLCLVLSSHHQHADAFHPSSARGRGLHSSSCSSQRGDLGLTVFPFGTSGRRHVDMVLNLSAEDEAAEEPPSDDAAGEEASSDDTEASAAEEEQEPQEDPEITALKESIAELERTLKSKRSSLQYALDQVDEYSKSGYARKVAEMENMRRVRSNMNTSSRSSATASVLTEFLPVYDQLNAMKTAYADNEFGNKFSGLTMSPVFSKFGVEESVVAVGDAVDGRMNVVETQYSQEFAKGTVMEVTSSDTAVVLEGNVMKMVDVVASLGVEEEPEPEQTAEDEGQAEGSEDQGSED